MDYNERNGSYSDDELLSRFSRPETPRTTVQDDIPDDPAAFRQDRGPRPGIRMASGRPMRGMKKQRPTGRKGSPNYRAALCGAVLAFFVIALLFFVLFMSRGGKIKELNSQIDTLGQDKQSIWLFSSLILPPRDINRTKNSRAITKNARTAPQSAAR